MGVIISIANPLFLMISFFYCQDHYSTYVETNIYQVDHVMFILICILLSIVRYVLYFFLYIYYFGKIKICRWFDAFLANNISLVPGGGLFLFMFWGPAEGNAVGFIYLPIIVITLAITLPINFNSQIKMLRYGLIK